MQPFKGSNVLPLILKIVKYCFVLITRQLSLILTWDPKIVLDHYRKLPKSYELLVKDLSQKLIMMLGLITGHRLQTF